MNPDTTVRLRRAPKCARCGTALDAVTVSVSAERPDGTIVRHECCGGACALALRVDPQTGAVR